MTSRRIRIRALLIAVLLLCGLCFTGQAPAAEDAAALHRKYTALKPQLGSNQFKRQLYLDSTESFSSIKGDIYAVIDYPFADVNSALNHPVQGPANWCDAMMLHPNTKYCNASVGNNKKILSVKIGKKTRQSLARTYSMEFDYNQEAAGPEYFRVVLGAGSGPLGTSDYRIVLEAVALDGRQTFIHLVYSCGYGIAARMAMKIYLATIGSSKVGFTSAGSHADGQPDYIGGLRGVIERNTMRYYLAIDAYLSALYLPAEKRLEKRLSNWFNATEQYARQLHEQERQEYMQIKYNEYRRRQTQQ